MNGYDAVVVGGRVAGAATAMLLARGGARVALVDRSAYGSDTLSTHALMRAGVLQLARWGLLDQVVAAGTTPVRSTVFHYADDDSLRIAVSPHHGVDALYAPRRMLLDRLLVDAAAEAGVHVQHRTRATELVRRGDGRVSGVRVVGEDGPTRVLSAGITVGADGLRSLVAEQAGARVVRRGRHSGSSLFHYLTGLPTDGYEWAYGPGAAAGLIPTNDGATCLFVTTTRTAMRALRPLGTEGAIRALLARAAPGFLDRAAVATPAAGPVRGWSGQPGQVRRSWGPGWALVGDAGYFKDPITAHGMTDALRDAELLADAVLAAPGGRDEAGALQGYEELRDRLSGDLFEVTEQVAGFAWDTPRLKQLLRELAASMRPEVDHVAARLAAPA